MGNKIIVRTQSDMDAIPIDYAGKIMICAEESIDIYNRTVYIYAGTVYAHDNSIVHAYGNSIVYAYGNSTVYAYGNSTVYAYGNSTVYAYGNVNVLDCGTTGKIICAAHARIAYGLKTPDEYIEHYGLQSDGDTVTLYKAVHKRGGRYYSDYDNGYEYKIGEYARADVDTDQYRECGSGINMSTLHCATGYGYGWIDMAILAVEVNVNDIVVPYNTNGKVRAGACKVIREVPLEE